MELRALEKWLKGILIGVGICGLIVYFLLFPTLGSSIAYDNPEYGFCYWPWLVFIWVSGIPCYIVLFIGWKIATNIGAGDSFTAETAKYFTWIAWLAAGDSGYFFLGNIILLLLNMSHPGVALCSLLIVFAGVAVTVLAAVISHMVIKAADLQEQSDLTI